MVVRRLLIAIVGAALVPALASCGGAGDGRRAGGVTVFAAASMSEAFVEIGSAFERSHPDVKVTFSFSSSSTLAAQINQGAPADVFASADAANIERVRGNGFLAEPVAFATNKLSIIVARGNPKSVRGVADLARPDVVYVGATPGVPVGVYAQQVLDKAQATVRPKSLEADVKAIVTKVVLGEADAGIVYATDVRAAGDKAQGVAIPDDQNVTAIYPIAMLKTSTERARSSAFVEFVLSGEGRTILTKHGFGLP